MRVSKLCQQCGDVFTASTQAHAARYCSAACRVAASRARRRPAPEPDYHAMYDDVVSQLRAFLDHGAEGLRPTDHPHDALLDELAAYGVKVHQLALQVRDAPTSRGSAPWPVDTQEFAKALVEFGRDMRQVGRDEAAAS